MKGHNGVDFRASVGTKVFAPMDGIISVRDSGTEGYGLHIKIRNEFKGAEIVLGHLSRCNLTEGHRVNVGDLIGSSGNTGFSFGPHVHMGYRLLKPSDRDIWEWEVLDYKNGYFGYIDFADWLITFKGTLSKSNL